MSQQDQNAPEKKALTSFQKRIRKRAREQAEAGGLEWKSLSQEERRPYITASREALRQQRTARKSSEPDAG
jgi:hypothetical protein